VLGQKSLFWLNLYGRSVRSYASDCKTDSATVLSSIPASVADPDPYQFIRGMDPAPDPDPAIIKQKY
jgi:hypothetical protein